MKNCKCTTPPTYQCIFLCQNNLPFDKLTLKFKQTAMQSYLSQWVIPAHPEILLNAYPVHFWVFLFSLLYRLSSLYSFFLSLGAVTLNRYLPMAYPCTSCAHGPTAATTPRGGSASSSSGLKREESQSSGTTIESTTSQATLDGGRIDR